MNVHYTEEERAFEQEVRAFLDEELTDDIREAVNQTASLFPEIDMVMEWHRARYQKGWVAPEWPAEFGGPGWSVTQRFIFHRECARAGAPPLSPFGLKMVGPVIMEFGDQWQQERFLPAILSGEELWCQGYSEPGSGSDLASLSMRAERDGDDYVLNGTKLWTTHAHHADWIFCLVRTEKAERKQQGISFILVPMDAGGITISPIHTIGGDHDVNEVNFEDVRTPAKHLVGQAGHGWTYAKYLLEWERGGSVTAPRLKRKLDHVHRVLKQRERLDEHFAMRCAQLDVEILELEFIELRIATQIARGESPGPMSSLVKVRSTEISQAITEVGVDALGADGLAWTGTLDLFGPRDYQPLDEVERTIVPDHLSTRASSIYAGSNEIQRNILSKTLVRL